jgi:hypothetical protein
VSDNNSLSWFQIPHVNVVDINHSVYILKLSSELIQINFIRRRLHNEIIAVLDDWIGAG